MIDPIKKRFRGLRSGLRKNWMYYGQNRRDAADAAKEGDRWKCGSCGGLFRRGEIEIDHTEPAGSLKTWDDLLPFVKRLFLNPCLALCEACHQQKTNAEAKARKKGKKHGKRAAH